ncbi:MAG: Endonuclease III, partial [uncultured Nocardioidaceae bacterium]
ARRDLSRRPLRARFHQSVPAARRDGAERPDDRQAGEHSDAHPLRGVPGRDRARLGGPGEGRADHPADRVLPRQDRLGAQAVAGPGGAVRRTGARSARGPRHAARRRAEDRQRGPGRRLRGPGDHRRHPLRPAGPPVRVDGRERPGEGRARGRRDLSQEGLDAAEPPPDLARPPDLPRPQPGVRCVPGRPPLPGVRRGADRSGEGGEAGADRGAGV